MPLVYNFACCFGRNRLGHSTVFAKVLRNYGFACSCRKHCPKIYMDGLWMRILNEYGELLFCVTTKHGHIGYEVRRLHSAHYFYGDNSSNIFSAITLNTSGGAVVVVVAWINVVPSFDEDVVGDVDFVVCVALEPIAGASIIKAKTVISLDIVVLVEII